MKLLPWYWVVSGGFSGRAGFGLCIKIFRPCMQTFFCNITSNDFFLSWHRFVVFTAAVTSASEVIVIFPQLTLFANIAAFFSSLLGLVSHYFWEGNSGEENSTQWRCIETSNHSCDSWLVLRSLQSPADSSNKTQLMYFCYIAVLVCIQIRYQCKQAELQCRVQKQI